MYNSQNFHFILDILDYVILDIVTMDPILETPEDAIIEQSELEKCFKVFDIHEKRSKWWLCF